MKREPVAQSHGRAKLLLPATVTRWLMEPMIDRSSVSEALGRIQSFQGRGSTASRDQLQQCAAI
jgi:hypothetical protein